MICPWVMEGINIMKVKTNIDFWKELERAPFVVKRAYYEKDDNSLMHFVLECFGEMGDTFMYLDINFDQETGREQYTKLLNLFGLEQKVLNTGWFIGKVLFMEPISINTLQLKTRKYEYEFSIENVTIVLEDISLFRNLKDKTVPDK